MFESIHAIMSVSFLDASLQVWLAFFGVVALVLAFDLGVLNRKDHEISVRESLWFSLLYVLLALIVGVWVWSARGSEDAINYFTAYFIEQSLSLDNLVVMSMIFGYFGIPRLYQHRVLFWGVVGVVVMRGIMIGFGMSLVHRFDWILLLFGAFLIYTGAKMLFSGEQDEGSLEDNRALKFLQRHMKVTPFLRGRRFFVYHKTATAQGRHGWQATPLFLALVTIELADIVFAVDSVPAVLSITNDTFVVYASNIFAVLGLRTMYFAVAALIHRFQYMKGALSIILMLIGLKSYYNHFSGSHIPPLLSLGMTLFLLAGGIVFSLVRTREKGPGKAAQTAGKPGNSDLLGPPG